MKHNSKLNRSRWLLLTLLTLIVGASPAWGQKPLPYSYGFENNNLAGEGWTKAGSSIPNNTAIMTDAKRSGDRGFQFWYSKYPPQYLISPELATTETTLNLSFWYKNGSTYTETFNVGYSTSNSETGSFTWLEATDITAPSSWTEYKNTLPAGTKYVAIKYTANNQYKLWIDDFSVSEVEAYPKPTDFSITGYTSTTASFSWTNGGEEAAWQIAYSTTQGFDAGAVSPVAVTTKPYTLTGLTAETTYYARIRADYGGGNYSNWSDEISFKPSATMNLLVNDGTQLNASVPFNAPWIDSNGTMSQFIIPKTTLSSMANRQITKFTFYGNSDQSWGAGRFKVYLKETSLTTFESATFDWTGMEEVADVVVSVSEGKMVIELETPFNYEDDNLMIGFNISNTGTYQYSNPSWYGITSAGSAIYAYSSSSSIAAFLPKMTITSLPQTSAPKMKVEAEDSYDFKFLTSSSTAEDKSATFEVQNKGNAALTDANVSYSGDAAIAVSPNGTLASIDAKSSTDITITVDTENTGIYTGTITVTGTGSENVEIPVKAVVRNTDKLFIDFDETNPKPAAWTLGDGWSENKANSIATIGNATAAITTSEILSAGETLTLRYRGNYDGDGATLAVSYSTTTIDGEYTDAVETVSSIGYNVWKYATFTIPATAKFVKVTGKYIDLDAFYGLQAPAVPVMVLSTTNHNFGLVSNADTQALTLTISNEGGAALTGLSVTPSSGFAVTDMEGNALATTTIAAGSSLSVKVKVNAVGQQNGTVTIDGTGVDEQVVTVSGYMLDDSKICETFASNVPNRWTKVGSNWVFTAANGAYGKNEDYKMTTPQIVVAADQVLVINAKVNSSSSSLKIEGSADNGENWVYTKTLSYTDFGSQTSNFVLLTIDDIDDAVDGESNPVAINKLRLTLDGVYMNAFNGFTYADVPEFKSYSNEGCTVEQVTPTTKNFGFATEAQSQKYYFKNTGSGQVDLSITAPDGITAEVTDNALTELESTDQTITMPATEGFYNGNVVVTAKNHSNDEVMGTFEVAVNGAVTGTKNYIDFTTLSAMPAGWNSDTWTLTSNSYVSVGGTAADLTSQTFTVAEGEKMMIEAQATNATNELKYSFKVGSGDWSDYTTISGLVNGTWKAFQIPGTVGSNVKVKFNGTNVRIRRVYGFTAVAEPSLEFAAAGTTKDFGMVASNTTSDAYTITNNGEAELTGLTVTCDNANFTVAVAKNATSIPAGESVTFTVTLTNTNKGAQSGTVTIAGDGVESKTLNVKGYVADNTKIFTTFTALPDRWTNSSWSFDANGATAGYSNFATLTSPKIVASTQTLAISAKLQGNSNSYYVKVEGYDTANSDWTYSTTLSNDVLNSTSFTVVELNDIPTTVNRIRLVGKYVIVNALNGFTYDENDPEFSLYANSECTDPIIVNAVTNAWGFVNEDKTATYYIKNTGTGTLSLSKSETPAGFTVELGATSLAAGKSTTLTISMANDAENNEGYHAGDVVLTAKDNADNTLGTFTVTSSGVVVSASKTDVNFTALDAFPAGWEKGSWSFTANEKVSVGYSSSTMTTGTYTVAAGESMVIKAKKQYNSGTLTYSYSTDNGETWSEAQTITPSSTSYELIAISGIPAGTAKIKFTGTYIDIERIYGYTAMLEPAMTLSPADASHDFGMQTAAAEYVITVTNSGTAEMTGVTAELAGTDAADYQVVMSIPDGSSATISENVATIPVGQTLKVTATLKASTEYKEHNATLTISADGLADKMITLTGKTRDASKNYIDFASGIPAELTNSGWSTLSGYVYTGNTEATLTTKTLTIDANEKVYVDAKLWQNTGYLKVRYSVNGGISWSGYTTYDSNNLTTSDWTRVEVDMQNASEAVAIVEFKGYYMYLDNIYGGVLNDEAPMIRITKSAAVVENGATEAFGSIKAEATATYTITNVGNGTLKITDPVTKTGAATVTVNKTSLANGESATLIITMPVEAPYEYKEGVVTVVTNLGDFVINYNATVLNPNALDEQFASGKPAGWYFGGYWKVSGQQAMQEDSGTAEDLITEQLTVDGPSDVLTFQAAKTSSNSTPTFRVYTSQDRVTWDAVDLGDLTLTTSYQDVNISGLAAGDYYVKITGARVKVDNFLGWTKKNNTRDLYVVSFTTPSVTKDAGDKVTISATVASLIDAQDDVYAKLFVDGEQVGDASAAQDIALNGTKTFSFDYTMPAAGTHTAQIKVYYSNNDEAFATAVKNMKVYYALSETSSEAITTGIYDVTLTRSFQQGWNSICLPFAVTDIQSVFGEDAKVYQFTSYTSSYVTFETVGEMSAGTPYLIKMPEASSEAIVLNDCNITTADAGKVEISGVTFQGTYAPKEAGTLTGMYGITTENDIRPATAKASMDGFRAYLIGSLANARIMIFDETTGIKTVYGSKEILGDGRVYNLNGQHVENAKKGVYIVNGKKVVIK